MGKLTINVKKNMGYYMHNPFSKGFFYVFIDGEVHEISTKEDGKTFDLADCEHELKIMCPIAFGECVVLQLPEDHPLRIKYAKILKTVARANAVGKNAFMGLGGSELSSALIGAAYDKISAKPGGGVSVTKTVDFTGKSHTLTVTVKRKAAVKSFVIE